MEKAESNYSSLLEKSLESPRKIIVHCCLKTCKEML